MGGNALQEGLTRRHNKDEYIQKSLEVLTKLQTFLYVPCAMLIDSYKTKETFGDADILYTRPDDKPLSYDDVSKLFPESKEIVRNSSVISFEYKELQVDLIHSPDIEFVYALNYYGNNDVGNLVGKLAHQLGLKHGHRGLTMPVRDGVNIVGEVLLTRDHDIALKFLDLDVGVFNKGFDTLEDIFKFVRKSKYFNPDSYKLENLNTIGKMRDKKRTTYRAFLEYNEANPVANPYVRKANKKEYLQQIFEYFCEDALNDYTKVTQELAAIRYIKTRFNGDIVSMLTGYTGKGLGQFMQHLKANEFLLNRHTIPLLSEEEIADIVLKNAKIFDEVIGVAQK